MKTDDNNKSTAPPSYANENNSNAFLLNKQHIADVCKPWPYLPVFLSIPSSKYMLTYIIILLVIFRHDYNHVCQAFAVQNIFRMNNAQRTCSIIKFMFFLDFFLPFDHMVQWCSLFIHLERIDSERIWKMAQITYNIINYGMKNEK